MKAEGVSSKATAFDYIHIDWSPEPVPCKTKKAILDGCQNLPDPTAGAVSWATATHVTDASSAPSPPVAMAATTTITMAPSIPKKPIWQLGHSLPDYISPTRRGTDVTWKRCHLVLLVLTVYF
jgi:hypothetical protein